MKVAIPTKNQHVDQHFGHCESYTVFSVENGQVLDSEQFNAPAGCGCHSGLIGELHLKKVSVMLAGNMGGGAHRNLCQTGIEVIRGCTGPVDRVIRQYVDGELHDNGSSCIEHEQGHGHHDHGRHHVIT